LVAAQGYGILSFETPIQQIKSKCRGVYIETVSVDDIEDTDN